MNSTHHRRFAVNHLLMNAPDALTECSTTSSPRGALHTRSALISEDRVAWLESQLELFNRSLRPEGIRAPVRHGASPVTSRAPLPARGSALLALQCETVAPAALHYLNRLSICCHTGALFARAERGGNLCGIARAARTHGEESTSRTCALHHRSRTSPSRRRQDRSCARAMSL